MHSISIRVLINITRKIMMMIERVNSQLFPLYLRAKFLRTITINQMYIRVLRTKPSPEKITKTGK